MRYNKKEKLNILFLPAWYPSSKNPTRGIFIKEHAKAVSLYNDIIVLYAEVGDNRINSLYKIVSDKYEEGIRTIRIKYRKSFIHKVSDFICIWSIISVFRKLLRENWKPDIIHCHVYFSGVVGIILGKIYKIPVVITEHWTGFPRKILTKWSILKARFVMNEAKIILPVSEDLEKAIKSYGIKSRFQVIPNVVNTEIFYPTTTRHRSEIKRILLVALLSPQKGVTYLFKSLAKLKEKRQDFLLDIVGDGPNRKEYEEQVQKLRLQGIVRFHGLKTKPEVAEFMRRSDFFVLPSIWENLPCVLIEAMASGLPIVATKVGGISEIINEKVGVLVAQKDVEALVKSIDYMLDNYREYSPEKISQYAKDNFSYEVVGAKLDILYRKVINE